MTYKIAGGTRSTTALAVLASMMGPAKRIPGALLAVAIAAYGPDCLGMATPQQAMQCCRTMHCHDHGYRRQETGRHSKDCCSTTLHERAVLGQPSSPQGLAFTRIAIGVAQAVSPFPIKRNPFSVVSNHSHDPPPPNSLPALSLRI